MSGEAFEKVLWGLFINGPFVGPFYHDTDTIHSVIDLTKFQVVITIKHVYISNIYHEHPCQLCV